MEVFIPQPEIDLTKETFRKDILSLLQKSVDKLPVHADLPRLGHKIQIISDGNDVFNLMKTNNTPEEVPPTVMLLDLLNALSKLFGASDSFIQQMDGEFSARFPKTGNYDLSRALMDFLQEFLLKFPAEDPEYDTSRKLMQILKCCTQALVAPSVIRLKRSFAQYPYKDVRGQWIIVIEFDSKNNNLQVKHQKNEKSFEDNSFHFQWAFSMDFDLEMKELRDLSCRIESLHFGPTDSEVRKKIVRHIASPFLVPL